MVRKSKRYKVYFFSVIFSFFISSFSLSFVPVVDRLEQTAGNVTKIIIGILFWLGFIVGLILTIVGKKIFVQDKRRLVSSGKYKRQRLPGMFYMRKNILSFIVYAMFFIGLIFIVSDVLFNYIPQYIMFPIISIVLFSFILHCVIDGENFKIYKKIKDGTDNGDNK